MIEIKLSKGLISILDEEDYNLINAFKWYAMTSDGKRFYAASSSNRKNTGKTLLLHRFILNAPDQSVVDHIDGNTLNNQKYNLRLATTQQNSQNQRTRKNKISKYKGVYKFIYKDTPKKWVARIKLDYKYICLGYFITEEEAAKAYNEAACLYFGSFAKLNEIKNES